MWNLSLARVFNNFSRILSKAFLFGEELDSRSKSVEAKSPFLPFDSLLSRDLTWSNLDTESMEAAEASPELELGLNLCTVPKTLLSLSLFSLREPNNCSWSTLNGDSVLGFVFWCVWTRPYENGGRLEPPILLESDPQRPRRISLVGSLTCGARAGACVLTIPYTIPSSSSSEDDDPSELGRSLLCLIREASDFCSRGSSTSGVEENFVRLRSENKGCTVNRFSNYWFVNVRMLKWVIRRTYLVLIVTFLQIFLSAPLCK